MNDKHHLGKGHRLSQAPSQRMGQALNAETEYARFVSTGLSYADLAHAIMLHERNVIPDDCIATLLDSLLRLHNEADPVWEQGLAEGDIYDHRDAWLKQDIGDVSGWLHVGRARREAINIGWFIGLRQSILALQQALTDLVEAVAHVAKAQRETLMPDYTYLQHAHPTTLGHYLLGFVFPLARDAERLQQTFSDFNASPAGAASTNGSRIDMSRERMRELLHFDKVTLHARDAMWQPDVVIHCMSTLVSINTTLGRLVEELLLWTTSEFGFLELADAHCRTSVIMPQKKNPYALSHLRSGIRRSIGDWVSVVGTNHTASGQVDNRLASYTIVPATIQRVTSSVRLLQEIVEGATFNAEAMGAGVLKGATWGTELVDWLVETEHVDPRTAHQIVGLAVRQAGADAGPSQVEQALPGAIQSVAGRSWSNPGVDFAQLLSPGSVVANRKGEGSCGPSFMDEMFNSLDQRVGQSRASVADRLEQVQNLDDLVQLAQHIIDNSKGGKQ